MILKGAVAVVLRDLPELKELDAFSNIRGFSFQIIDTGLEIIDGFDGISPGDIVISENLELKLISGLNSVSSVVAISRNESLYDISGLNELSPGSVLSITSNDSLTELSGLKNPPEGLSERTTVSANISFDCSAEPQASLPIFPIQASSGNLVDCPVIDQN